MAIYSLRLTPVGKTTQKRPFTAAAHIRYITRKSALSHSMAERMPERAVSASRWLRVEEAADRKNARVADKLVIALPKELTRQQQIELVWSFAERLTQKRASWYAAIHAKGKDRANPHCHLLVRDRDIETGKRVVMFSAGQKETKTRAASGQSAPTTLRQIRAMWEEYSNAALARAGRKERIDCRSLREQGLDRPAQVHEGPNIRAMQERGYKPQSRDRIVRSRALRRKGTPATRLLRYSEIDRGVTRAEYNDALKRAVRGGSTYQGRSHGKTSVRHAVTTTSLKLPLSHSPEQPVPTTPASGGSSGQDRSPQRREAVDNRSPPLSLTQRLALEAEVTPAKPRSGTDRGRKR